MTIKKSKTLKAIKVSLKKRLPSQISKVLQSYEEFLEHPVPGDAKGFIAHHSACKSAVVHAETLLKLSKWTEEGEESLAKKEVDTSDNDILKILEEAAENLDCDDDDNEC